ncbi:hypothetical protein ABT160_26010 [Streptomyces sp. NPDC001941]|uniref:hypothetical protein n=1 Tax=Streptomyces sp. NPDC001941 TaxID=3154659 RepID=UPI003331C169
MDAEDSWSIDGIAYALPTPELRREFLREVGGAPRDRLAAVLDHWERVAVRWTRESVPEIERVREHFLAHGELPPEYEQEAGEDQAAYDAWRARMKAGGPGSGRDGNGAA